MSNQLNEFAINLPIGGVSALAPTMGVAIPEPTVEPATYDCTVGTAIPAEVKTDEYKHITAYVDSFSVVNVESPNVLVDVVLSVNIANPQTYTSSQYKIVKRLSFDRVKLALQAEHLTPVQVVETLEETEDPAIVEQEMSAYYSRVRVQEMAGIYESVGNSVANVMITFDDVSPAQREAERKGASPARASTTILVKAVKDKAHARHVFNKKHAYKYKNPTITRVTMVGEK